MTDHADTIRPESEPPWYFDGWDVFTAATSAGRRGDGHRLVLPLKVINDGVFHESQRISHADVRFLVEAVNQHDSLVAERQQAIDLNEELLRWKAQLAAERQQAIDERDDLAEQRRHLSEQLKHARSDKRQAIDALRERRRFVGVVLACDTYGCENGPSKCLHAKAKAEVDAIDAALVKLGEAE